jgi:hypothetical protein
MTVRSVHLRWDEKARYFIELKSTRDINTQVTADVVTDPTRRNCSFASHKEGASREPRRAFGRAVLRPGSAFGLPDNERQQSIIEGARHESASSGQRCLRFADRFRSPRPVSGNVPATFAQCRLKGHLPNANPVQMPAPGTGAGNLVPELQG